MNITEENLDFLRQRYTGETSDQVFSFLKRRVSYASITNFLTNKELKFIYIDEKQYLLNSNKKYLKHRLVMLVDKEYPNVDISVIHRTVKKFLDMVNLIDSD